MDSCDSHGRSNWYDVSDMTGFRMIGSVWLQPIRKNCCAIDEDDYRPYEVGPREVMIL